MPVNISINKVTVNSDTKGTYILEHRLRSLWFSLLFLEEIEANYDSKTSGLFVYNKSFDTAIDWGYSKY